MHQLHHQHQAPALTINLTLQQHGKAGKPLWRAAAAPGALIHHGLASREHLAARPHDTAPGNMAGLAFRKADRTGSGHSSMHPRVLGETWVVGFSQELAQGPPWPQGLKERAIRPCHQHLPWCSLLKAGARAADVPGKVKCLKCYGLS